MHDPFPSIWADRIARLPPVKTLSFTTLEPNRDAEDLSCVICGKSHHIVPEWLVTMRSPHETLTRGLHEACRERHERWQAAYEKRQGEPDAENRIG